MKTLKYLTIALSAITLNSSAESIDNAVFGGPQGGAMGFTSGSKTPYCPRILFITRNTGTPVTGLAAAKLIKVSAVQSVYNATTFKYTTSPVTISFTLTAVGAAQPGVYTLCVTPGNFTWTSGPVFNWYEFGFLVNGVVAADHGVLRVSITN